MSIQRTINEDEALDLVTDQEIVASQFFEQSEATIFKHRREIEDAYRLDTPLRFICYFCKQRVKINGGLRKDYVKQIYHFAVNLPLKRPLVVESIVLFVL